LSAEDFAVAAREMLSSGIAILGGCCGTDCETVAALARMASTFTEYPEAPAPVPTACIAATARESAVIPVGELPEPLEADDDLVDNAEEMADDYDFLYIAVRSSEDVQTVLDAAPFLSLPLAVCGEPRAIAELKRFYCGKIVTIADNG